MSKPRQLRLKGPSVKTLDGAAVLAFQHYDVPSDGGPVSDHPGVFHGFLIKTDADVVVNVFDTADSDAASSAPRVIPGHKVEGSDTSSGDHQSGGILGVQAICWAGCVVEFDFPDGTPTIFECTAFFAPATLENG